MDTFAHQEQPPPLPIQNNPIMNFDALISLQEQVKKTISYGGTMSVFFVILMLMNGSHGGNIDASSLLKMGIMIKLLFQIPFNVSILNLARSNKISPGTGKIIITVFEPFLLLWWYGKVTSQFFSSKNDGRQMATPLWIGHLVLLGEAFGCFFLSCIFGCVITVIGVIIGRALKNQHKAKINNMKIKDMLLKAASFKLSPQDILAKEEGPICFNEFEPEQHILQLPCNEKHVFHAECIGEWVGRNNTGPLGKTEITKNMIKEYEKTQNSRQLVTSPRSEIDLESRPLTYEENKS